MERALKNLNISSLNAIQEASLEADKKGNDLVLLAPTGSGKTLGFLLPVLNRLNPDKEGIQAMILVPSRELALQIEQVFRDMSTGFKVNCCYGGHSIQTERNSLKHPPAILIGTPGRIADHVKRGRVETSSIHTLVLDEFDKALEFGFQADMASIIGQLRRIKKRILTSATQSIKIPVFTGISSPIELNFLEEASPKELQIKAVKSEGKDKLEALFRLVCSLGNEATLVFCNHRDAVERISGHLNLRGLVHDIFHGGLEQEERERALIKFRNGSHHLLITTDLASRGLDIPEIKYVIHYHLPTKEDAFIHRNGRTARMKAEGTSYLVLAQDELLPRFINESIPFDQLPENVTLPKQPDWVTLFIGSGKKDKVNKVDLVGFLLQKGKLQKDELGLINVLDYSSFVAVRREKVNKVLHLIRNERIKRKKPKIAISK